MPTQDSIALLDDLSARTLVEGVEARMLCGPSGTTEPQMGAIRL